MNKLMKNIEKLVLYLVLKTVLSGYKVFVSVYLNATYILSVTEGSLVLCVVKLNVYDTFKITYSAFNLFSAAL